MSAQTDISWTDSTFNPWQGCTKVSPACDHCYAERDTRRFGRVEWGAGKPRVRTSAANWKLPERWNKVAYWQCGCCGWRGIERDMLVSDDSFGAWAACPLCREGQFASTRRRVFCASLADWLDNEVPIEWLVDLLDLIQRTPNLDWLLLTKRIGNLDKRLFDAVMQRLGALLSTHNETLRAWIVDWRAGNPPANVWIGSTVVNQEEADRDVPKLLAVPARVRFLSIEPMLGPVEVFCAMTGELQVVSGNEYDPGAIDWIICGGESGPHARPMHPDWVRSLRDQCAAAGVPLHFKQWGEWATAAFSTSTGSPVFRQFDTYERWVQKPQWINGGICLDTDGVELKNGSDMMRARDDGKFPVTIMHRIGKRAAGRLLDGREHNEFPAVQP